MRRTSCLIPFLLLLCLLMPGAALGETVPFTFPQAGLRLYLPTDWQVLTLSNLSGQGDQIQKLGTTAQALSASFEASGTLLMAFPPAGGQIQVSTQALPEGVTAVSVPSMTKEQKDGFLLAMARAGDYAHGVWSQDLPEYAMLTGTSKLQNLTVTTSAYATVRYGQVYLISSQYIGREPGDADAQALKAAAAAMLFLGTPREPAPEATPAAKPTLDLSPASTPVPAEVRVRRDDTPITLNDVPSSVTVPWLTISGTTTPNTSMRYYVNGQGYERFESDEDGHFSVLVRQLPLKGKNVVMLQAIGEKGYGTVSVNVILDQAQVPLELVPASAPVAGSTYTIVGATLPGAQVEAAYMGRTFDAQADDQGSFACEVKLYKVGANELTVTASLDGYVKQKQQFTVIRVKSQEDEQEAFLAKVKDVSYAKLLAKPGVYKDVRLKLQGVVLLLTNNGDQPMMVIAGPNGEEPVAVLCDDLYDLELGGKATVLCTLTGEWSQAVLPSGAAQVPQARLNWLLP